MGELCMKKPALIMLCVFAAGCSSKTPTPTESATVQNETAQSAESSQEASTASAVSAANVDPNKTYDYEVTEIWCENEGQRIYGEAYIPVTDGRSPLVIHSHGLGSNHEAGASFGKEYAQRGIALYALDFRGGSKSNNENLSDGISTDMSVLTEVSDLTAVLEAARTWDFVDTDRRQSGRLGDSYIGRQTRGRGSRADTALSGVRYARYNEGRER